MNRIPLGILLVCAVGVLAIGPNPRYLEELRIGGGFADPVDGGVDLDKAGNISTDGSITVEGGLAGGKNEAIDHSVSVISGPTNDTRIDLYDQDSNNGGVIWFDGDQDMLRIGTRSASSVPTDALEISKGSAKVKLLGDLDVVGDLTVLPNVFSVDAATSQIGMGITPVQKLHLYSPTTNSVRIRLQNDDGFGDIATHENKIVFFGSDGAIRFRIETFVNKSFQRIVPNVDSTWDFGGVGERWAKLWAVTGDFAGDVAVFGGDLGVGSDGVTRGVVTAWDGGDGASPGVLRLASRNGTIYYLFTEDNGTLRVHTTLPTLNSDGTALGTGAGLPVDDTTALVRDPADNTKTVRIDAGAVSTGVTRTIFMGDRDVDLAASGTFQDRDTELTDIAGMTPTKGLLIVGDGTKFVPVGVGTDNQVLTANSAVSAGINWGASGGGGETHPVDDSTSLVRDPVDNTKLMRVDVGALSTGTTRVLTMPDQNVDLTPDTGSFAKARKQHVTLALSDQGSVITTGTAKVTWRVPYAMTVNEVRAFVNTASSSGLPTFDINEGGVSILSTKLTIDASEKTSTTAATSAVISDSVLADDAEITFDIDVAGTGATGATGSP
ncbi:MAG: hypothetical protein IIB38_05530 [Candidatus Hydrogenedentes bacterium]|nr:hypothetical protein [Candidatus Hydrogenedentota bacterium]